MPWADHHGLRLHYRDEGSGTPVLLIHGHTLDHRVWDGLVPSLTAAGLRAIVPDLRGHGRSTLAERGYHWRDHASDMAAVLRAAGIGRAHVVGHSIGGGVALEMAVTAAPALDRLVLLSPVLPERQFEEAFFANLRDVARVVRSDGVAAAMLGPWISSPVWAGSLENDALRSTVEEIVRDFPGAEYLATERDQVERSWTVPERLPAIDRPTLVMVGGLELPGFRGWAEEIAEEVPGGRLEVLQGLGHLHFLEDPERVARPIIDHLTTIEN